MHGGRSEQQAQRRARVVAAAMALAAKGGYDAVQMRAVSTEADVALGTIYRYFSSKDQLLIAMELESILQEHGAGDIVVAASGSGALKRLHGFVPDLAILDFNLGSHTSGDVADELKRRGVPFAFATGYADTAMIPERFAGAAIVRKPYDAGTLAQQIARLLGDATSS